MANMRRLFFINECPSCEIAVTEVNRLRSLLQRLVGVSQQRCTRLAPHRPCQACIEYATAVRETFDALNGECRHEQWVAEMRERVDGHWVHEKGGLVRADEVFCASCGITADKVQP